MRAVWLALPLLGCATAAPETATRCNPDRLSELVGLPGNSALGAEAQRRSGAARLRWIRPGDVVTMDFSPQRLNVHLDAQNRVARFACG